MSRSPSPRRRLRRALALTVVALAVAACDEASTPTGPDAPNWLIRDAVHNYGNVHFYWLEPTVPANPAFGGTSNINFHPVVELCEWDEAANACAGPLLGRWTRKEGTQGTKVYNSSVKQHYSLIAKTATMNLDPAKLYRARVFLMRTPVGFIDLDVVATRDEMDAVDRTNYTPVLLGGSVTLNFRLEFGAMYGLDPSGGELSVLNGAVKIEYPARTVPGETGLMIQPAHADLLPSGPGSGAERMAEGTAYEIGPEEVVFSGPVFLKLQYDPDMLPAGVNEQDLRLHVLDNGAWAELPGSIVDRTNKRVKAYIPGAGIYAVLERDAHVRMATVGGRHSCALDSGGRAYCWGSNDLGQLGTGSHPGTGGIARSSVPVAVRMPAGVGFVTIHPGMNGTCAIDQHGQAWCWGQNASGQLGTGSVTSAPHIIAAPRAVEQGSLRFMSIALGASHACAVAVGGDGYCWGRNDEGQLGTGNPVGAQLLPTRVSGAHAFKSIRVGWLHSCGITTADALLCWGYNAYGQVGMGQAGLDWDGTADVVTPSVMRIASPAAVIGGDAVMQVALGWVHTCAVTTGGSASCFGQNWSGVLGNGRTIDTSLDEMSVPIPQAVSGALVLQSISAGDDHTCAVAVGGSAYCWGNSLQGRLGIGGTPPNFVPEPTPVAGGFSFASVEAGGAHTCGLTTALEVRCWGSGSVGQVGPTSPASALTPTPPIAMP